MRKSTCRSARRQLPGSPMQAPPRASSRNQEIKLLSITLPPVERAGLGEEKQVNHASLSDLLLHRTER